MSSSDLGDGDVSYAGASRAPAREDMEKKRGERTDGWEARATSRRVPAVARK